MLVPVGDSGTLETQLRDGRMAESMGAAGHERVLQEFWPERVWEAMAEEYARGLREREEEKEKDNAETRRLKARKASGLKGLSYR
jgi:hypothetical protein